MLRTLNSQLSSRTRVTAGYGAAWYDLRVDLEYITHKVASRSAGEGVERETGFEPATSNLEGSHSTS